MCGEERVIVSAEAQCLPLEGGVGAGGQEAFPFHVCICR